MNGLQDFFTAMDKAVFHARDHRACLFNATLAIHTNDQEGAIKMCRASRDCISDIQGLWPRIYNQQDEFLAAVAKDNSKRFHAGHIPVLIDMVHRSWHVYAIHAIRITVESFYHFVNENHPMWSSPALDYKIDISGKAITTEDIRTMRDWTPDLTVCKTGLLIERDNFGVVEDIPDGPHGDIFFGWNGNRCELTKSEYAVIEKLWSCKPNGVDEFDLMELVKRGIDAGERAIENIRTEFNNNKTFSLHCPWKMSKRKESWHLKNTG